jgi:hypothetical protein
MSKRLLILACSERKRAGNELLPAVDRYNGPSWQLVRNFLQTQPLFAADLDLYVLSAAFGLIPATQSIPLYDQLMSPIRAAELRPQVLTTFQALMEFNYGKVCLGLSQRYLVALLGWQDLIPLQTQVFLTDGTAGVKLAQLRAWLHHSPWTPSNRPVTRLVASSVPTGYAKIGGIRIEMTATDVLAKARAALAAGAPEASRYRDWYVLIDGQRVGPKWLVSLISGVTPDRFDAGAARRVLLSLGIDIEPVDGCAELDRKPKG